MKIEFNYNKDFIVIVGNNGSGKTTLATYLTKKIPRESIYVINSGAAGQWYHMNINKNHIYIPTEYSDEEFSRILKEIVTNPKAKNIFIVIDDADNFKLKNNDILRSIFINSRRLNVGGMLIVRRLSWVPIEIYDYSKYAFFARQNVDFSIFYASYFIPKEIARKLKTLPQYAFLAYRPETGESKIIKVKI